MKRFPFLTPVIIAIIVFCLSVSGVNASWNYLSPPESVSAGVSNEVATFKYGTLYITSVEINGGAFNSASAKKTADLNISSDLNLRSNSSSSVSVAVTFYNSTDISYYYNETQVVSWDNDKIGFAVSGIEQKDEIPSKTYKTINVTFAYNADNVSAVALSSTLHFNFVIEKDSIGDIVAQTAVDRFRDILNNKATDNSYSTLISAMDSRSGWNKGSVITYIGNVSGSTSADSLVIENLFGDEFMSMDLDGDGKVEPITMMIKRENLDNDTATGASYTYSSILGGQTSVHGVEMTIYITSQNLDNVSSGQNVAVYAASFTKLSDASEWTMIVPLTKGTAKANNYNGYGSANSFNTDTWVSDNGDTIKELAAAAN